MIPLALFAILFDRVVTAPPARWKAVGVAIERAGMIDGSFEVIRGDSKIQAVFLTRLDAELFHRGRAHRPVHATGFQRSAEFRFAVEEPGDYVLMADNRMQPRGEAGVAVRLQDRPYRTGQAQTVSPRRRAIIIALSALFLVGVGAYFVREFLR